MPPATSQVAGVKTPGLVPVSAARYQDTELVARCCGGDRSAYRLLYERHSPTVYRFLSAMGIRDHEREDACQEVFLAIFRSLPRFRGDSQLSTWIYRITARTAGKMIQRRKAGTLLSTLLRREPPPAPDRDPADKAARGLLLERLLERLNPKKRMVLILFEIEGLEVEEIARIAECPVNTVWSRLHHARARSDEDGGAHAAPAIGEQAWIVRGAPASRRGATGRRR